MATGISRLQRADTCILSVEHAMLWQIAKSAKIPSDLTIRRSKSWSTDYQMGAFHFSWILSRGTCSVLRERSKRNTNHATPISLNSF